MSSGPLQIALGKVETLIGEMEFAFVVSESGDAHVQVSAANAGKGSVLVMLDANGYERLKAIIKNADEVIPHDQDWKDQEDAAALLDAQRQSHNHHALGKE